MGSQGFKKLRRSGATHEPPSVQYTLGKTMFLTLYNGALIHFGLMSLEFKIASFCIVTPLAKVWLFYQLRTAQDSRATVARYTMNVLGDWILAAAWYLMLTSFNEYGLTFLGTLAAMVMVPLEYVQYLMFREPDEEYIIKTSSDPKSYGLVLAGLPVYYYIGLSSMELGGVKNDLNLYFAPCFTLFVYGVDVVFGVLHYYTHKIPALWERHRIHHEYKRETLNAFANFYSEWLDGFFMLLPILIIGFPITNPLAIFELGYSLGFTHHKCGDLATAGICSFENDVFDIVCMKLDTRLSRYHNFHHQHLTGYWGLFGFVKDDVFESLLPLPAREVSVKEQ